MYQMLLVPWKNIVPSRNYCQSKVSVKRVHYHLLVVRSHTYIFIYLIKVRNHIYILYIRGGSWVGSFS